MEMVASITNIEQQTETALWWETNVHYVDRFFYLMSSFQPNARPSVQDALLGNLDLLRTRVEDEPFPVSVNEARRHLLDAMSFAIMSLMRQMESDVQGAQNHQTDIRRALDDFSSALNDVL